MKKHPKHPDEITQEWLTDLLRESGIIVNSHVSGLKKEQLAKGKAWLSSIIRIELEYSSDEEQAPKSLILKMLSESRENRDFSYELKAYEREINFYNSFAPNFPIRLPELYFFTSGYDANLMLMEDLSYLTPGDQIQGMKYERVILTINSLAKVHATYWNHSLLGSCDWLPSTNNIEQGYCENWDSFVELCGDFIDPEALVVGEMLKEKIPWLIEEISKRSNTLVHDDMKVDNLLFGVASSDEAVVILDWQFVIRGMGAIDVARLLGGSWHPDLRDGRQFEALEYWYHKLLENGVEAYSWDEAQRDFRLGALYCLCFPVHFHCGINRAEGRALEYIKTLYSGLFLLALEIEAESVLS